MRLRAVLVLCALFPAAPLPAFEFPQWRGPARDGQVSVPARAAWPEALRAGWKVKVGVGHASPVVADGRLFTLGISGILSSYDATSGHLVWRKEFAGQFKETSPLYGTAMSPVVDGGLLIAHVGGHGDGALTAFDAATGAVRWAWKGDGPGYASPVVGTIGGARQIVTQSQDNVVGLSAEKGELLWKIPLTTSYEQNAVTPVLAGDLVIYGGLDQPMRAVRVAKKGGAFSPERA